MIGEINATLKSRASVARGPLRLLAESLRNDLTPLIQLEAIELPTQKARLSRIGGRCGRHGTLLNFDPWSPRLHSCTACATSYADDAHYRWWIMNYQLWIAERSVHAAVHGALTGDEQSLALSERILSAACDRYLTYPNQDNVLGPSRPFFSTYLESIWLLQLSIAVSVLQARGSNPSLVQRTFDDVLAPSLKLVSSYDEGGSNRQVWNNAAIMCAGALLQEDRLVDEAIHGRSGIARHLMNELLADGTWYEGENYHLFAHRGLWYGVTMAQQLGAVLPDEGLRRFREGFATPFLTALPDMTFPARRDSQYGVSLRQWRTAESCELGLAFGDDPRLVRALHSLYADDVAPGDTGRSFSTAEAERNVPPVRLSRASLGFKSLLCARPELPGLDTQRAGEDESVHLPAQGYAVIRRDSGRAHVALDYGVGGGGHGHPDRLNLWLIHGNARWLQDVGTGSYVDPSLFWYRSTLAHNAPMLAGQGQPYGTGHVIAWQQQGPASWISAAFPLAPEVMARRSVTVMEDYLIDELAWEAPHEVVIDLPWHLGPVDGEFGTSWSVDADALDALQYAAGGAGLVTSVERAASPISTMVAHVDTQELRVWFDDQLQPEWFRCAAPGPPGEGIGSSRTFFVERAYGVVGTMRSVLAWGTHGGLDVQKSSADGHRPRSAVASVQFSGDVVVVARADGSQDRHERVPEGWRIQHSGAAGGAQAMDLQLNIAGAAIRRAADAGATSGDSHGGQEMGEDGRGRAHATNGQGDSHARIETPADDAASVDTPSAQFNELVATLPRAQPLVIELGAPHYRRTEQSWTEAGSPTARVELRTEPGGLRLNVLVRKEDVCFAPPRDTNPLDNEHPDINSDGVQLYLYAPDRFHAAWILVGQPDGSLRATVRADNPAGTARRLQGGWKPHGEGYEMQCFVECPVPREFYCHVVINETARNRERRRGQLVLTGAHGEWAYLRGDREPLDAFLRVVQVD